MKKWIIGGGVIALLLPFAWNLKNPAKDKKIVPQTATVPQKLSGHDKARFAKWKKGATPKNIIRVKNDHLGSIKIAAKRNRVDPDIVAAVVFIESNGKNVRGEAGELGPMQIKPATGKLYGANIKCLENPDCNIRTGAKILKEKLKRHQHDPFKAVAAYNRGSVPRGFDTGADYHIKKFAHVFYTLKRIY